MKQQPRKITDRKTVLADWLQQAVQFHAQGRLGDAEPIYKAILKTDPDHFDAKQLLGDVRLRQGRHEDAAKLLRQALALNSGVAQVHINLGNALLAQAAFADAIASYDKALALKPNDAETLARRGNAAKALGRLDLALESYDAAIALKPDFPEILNNRGVTHLELGQADAALADHRRALTFRPRYAEAYNNIGLALAALNHLQEALGSYDQALELNPDLAEACYNHGIALTLLKREADALVSYEKALALKPDYIGALNNRGTVLETLDRPDEALASYDKALAISPRFVDAHCNRGSALETLGRHDDAIAAHNVALAIDPEFHKSRFNRALLELSRGDFTAGWDDYECRFDKACATWRTLELVWPHWNGEPIAGKRMIVFHEQGIGDTIQFSRYLPLVAAMGAEVTFFVPQVLHQLLQPIASGIRLIHQPPQDAFDFQCALLSLPRALQTTLETIPVDVPYLEPQADLVTTWRNRLDGSGFKIGIAWQGNPTDKVDIGRSIPLRQFQPIAEIPGVRLISLQKNHGLEQLVDLPASMQVETLGPDFDSGPNAFLDTAAVMANLDLIITSDTSIAHLAGALGRPVWVALKQVPDWRWLLDRSDSPWYQTMRLYRQAERGDWAGVFAHIARDVTTLPNRF